MDSIKKITRSEESELPRFNDVMEAVEFFKGEYGENRFVFASSYGAGAELTHHYHLILDESEYRKGPQMTLHSNEDSFKFLFSYQVIEINENGQIHIIH